LKNEKKLVDDIDRGMFARMTESKDTNVDSLLAELTNARFKIDGLSISQLLLKDAKHIIAENNRSIFAATLHCDLGDFLRREDAWFEIAQFAFSKDCKNADILLLMGTVADGSNRGFGWYAPKMGLDFSEKFMKWQDSVEYWKMGRYDDLKDIPAVGGARTIAGADGKIVSRKKALPIFIPWFNSL